MFKDILKITQVIVDTIQNSEDKLSSSIAIHDMQKALHQVITAIDVVSNHYLVLDFKKNCLQGSSFGDPIDKWRYFLNEDFKELNTAIVSYLTFTMNIGFEDELCAILSEKINLKSMYNILQVDYNIGFIEPCSSVLKATVLKVDLNLDNRYIKEHTKIDLTELNQRKELQELLQKQNDILIAYFITLTNYIQSKYTIDDLLPKIRPFQ